MQREPGAAVPPPGAPVSNAAGALPGGGANYFALPAGMAGAPLYPSMDPQVRVLCSEPCLGELMRAGL